MVIIPSYGRDSGDDFESFTAALVGAGYRVLRPQPRGVGESSGPMADVALDDLGNYHTVCAILNGFAIPAAG